MPWSTAGIFSLAGAATGAFPGKVLASADWNTIFTQLISGLTQIGEGQIVNEPRIITAGGAVTITATDLIIIINKAAPSVTPIQLPTITSRNKTPLLIVDFAGNGGDITITPATGEKIMGLAADATWTLTSGGAGLGGGATFYPVSGVGWVIGSV